MEWGREDGSGTWIGSGSESPPSLFHRIRTRSAGWETLSASFRTTNQKGQEVTGKGQEVTGSPAGDAAFSVLHDNNVLSLSRTVTGQS